MYRLTSIISLFAILSLVLSACAFSSPTIQTTDPNLISTNIAQIVSNALTQTAQPLIPITGQNFTSTPEPPTFTMTVTTSPATFFTATPSVPMISVSVATNCRVGPGRVYDMIGALLVGETAEVVGVDPTGNYWFIRNPDQTNGYCWLWGEYAALVGNYSALPIYTPPPTPTPVPAFEATFKKLEVCSGSWWTDIQLKNTGGVAFKSVSITLRDTTNSNVLVLSTDGFTNNDGCTNSTTKDNLNPGGAHIVSTTPFVYDPTGHKLRATITVCSEKSINGVCVSQAIEFTP